MSKITIGMVFVERHLIRILVGSITIICILISSNYSKKNPKYEINMKIHGMETQQVTHRFKIKREVDPETSHVILSFAEENWGPIVSGEDDKEAYRKLSESLNVISVIKSILSIDNSLKGDGVTEEKIKALATKKFKISDDCTEVELV